MMADRKIRKVVALILALCLDLGLFYASHRLSFFGHVVRLWLSAAVRWSAVSVTVQVILGDLKPSLGRYITAHSLLQAVFETGGRTLHGGDSLCGRAADARCWLMFAGAALGAALFWETTIPEEDDAAESKEEKQRSRVLFMRVLRLFKPDSLLLLAGLLFLSLAVLCEMFIPFYTGRVIDILGSHFEQKEFLSAVLFMGLYSVGSSVSAGCRGGVLACAESSFTCRVKAKLFEALTKQEIGFFDTIKTGEITSRLSKDTTLMAETVCLNANILLRTFIKTVGMITLMMSLSWKLTLLVLMETPITGLIQNIYDTKYQRLSQEMQDSIARTNDTTNEVVFGIRVVRSFHTEAHEARRYDNQLMETHSLKTRRDTVEAIYLLARRLTGLAMHVFVLYYGRIFIQEGQMTTGNLVSFILYQSDLGDNIGTLTYNFGDMLNSVVAAGKVFKYLDRTPQISTDGKLQPQQMKGHVTYRHLSFAYPSNPSKAVLNELSLELKPGQMTALVGPSGEGKSTCVSLLQRFYEPQEGEILLDGYPLRSYDHHYFHKKVTAVSQEPELLSGSIKDNITYGLSNCSMEEIKEAAGRANAHDFIMKLEQGYDTEVGEGGGRLAKSERQQIGIARALIRKPQVLILDEITSSLDIQNENKVLQALASCPNQTLVVIAHSLKTIQRADQIVVIIGGKVEEKGTHQELMGQKGVYYKLKEELFTEKANQPQTGTTKT